MSIINFKPDLYEGTQLTVDYASAFRTFAVRRMWVRGLTETTRYEDIVAAFEQQFGLQHPTINGFPLRQVRVVKVSCDRAILLARYQRTPSSFPPLPSGAEAQYRPGYEAIEVFKSVFDDFESDTPLFDGFGLPAGMLLSPIDDTLRPVSVERRVPVVKLFTAKQFSFLPNGIGSSFGFINSESVLIAGQLWAPGVVRFDGFEMDTNVVYGFDGNPLQTFYNVQFAFTLRNGTHVQQVPVWSPGEDPPPKIPTPESGPRWIITTEPSGPQIDFNTLGWFIDL